MPNIGDSVDRYVIEAVIGEGGMGRVYRALDPRLGRRVALKVLLAEKGNERAHADAAARMMREARAAAAFNHPNVVAIHDVGEIDGNPYIAMELVSGATLREFIGNAEVSNEQKLAWLLDVARGLGAAHRAGLVHRDVKPDNVMITTDGVVKILDFGIARRSESETAGADVEAATAAANLPSLTAEGLMIGTPQYMAPEQLQGAPLDGRADQFAWGVMAWELFAGSLPWGAASKNGAQLVAAVLSSPVRPLVSVVPSVTHGVSEAVARALSKNRDTRFATMEGVLEALEGKRAAVPTPNAKDMALEATAEQPSAPRAPSPLAASVSGPRDALSGRVGPPTTGAAAASGIDVRSLATGEGKRRTWRGALLAAGVCVVVGGGAAAVTLTKRPRVVTCASELDSSDGPKCAHPLRPDLVGKRPGSLRLTQTGGHTQSVEAVTFAGTPATRSSIPVLYSIGNTVATGRKDIVRGARDVVSEVVSRDAHGNIGDWGKWSDGGRRVDWVDVDGRTSRHFGDATRITGARRDLDVRGRVLRETWVGPTGRPRGFGRLFGLAFEYGKSDRPVRITYLAADGAPGTTPDGISSASLNDDEVPSDATYFDLKGEPAYNFQGQHHLHFDVNEATYCTRLLNFDSHEQPAVMLSTGAHAVLETWDPAKRVDELTFVDEHRRPRPAQSLGWASLRETYDERGRVVHHESLGTDGNLVVPRGDVASAQLTWDDRNNEVRIEEFDANGAPMLNAKGFARRESIYDDRGRTTESRYFDESGHPAPPFEGGPVVRFTYDERGLQVAEEYFDAENRPFVSPKGFAAKRQKYDQLRNLVERAYFGADGRPCVNDEGISVERSSYDENDDLVAVTYFDATGAPTMYQGDYATKRLVNDELGLLIEEEYLDDHGARTLRKDGYAAVRSVLDRNGDVVEVSYFGKKDEPILRAGGFAKKKTTYDVHRHKVEEALFDVAGAPVIGAEGWAIVRSSYDDRGHLLRNDYLDPAKNPVLTKAGSASDTKAYDARGNVVEQTTLGIDGKPIVAASGYATKRLAYDERDEPVEEALFGPDGAAAAGKSGWSVRQLRYNPSGNVVEEAFFDGERRPTSPAGAAHASVRSRYDARQRLIETKYLDGQETPAKGPQGVAIVQLKRDDRGRVTEKAFLDGTGAPALANDGTVTVRTKYDDGGRPIEELYLDGSGAPLVAKDGCAGHRRKFDLVGRKIEESCIGAKGELTLGRDGWAIQRTLNDGRGNPVEESTYGADGALRADKDGVAHRKSHFNDRNLVTETELFGADDKPAHDKRGAHVIRFTYDDSGKKTGETALDERGRAVKGR